MVQHASTMSYHDGTRENKQSYFSIEAILIRDGYIQLLFFLSSFIFIQMTSLLFPFYIHYIALWFLYFSIYFDRISYVVILVFSIFTISMIHLIIHCI